MRRGVIITTGLAAVSLVFGMIWWNSTSDEPQPASSVDTTAITPASHVRGSRREARRSPSIVRLSSPTATTRADRVVLASEELRPGEMIHERDGRRTSLALYRKFAARARMTDEQEQRLLRVLSDAAENLRRMRADALTAGDDERLHVRSKEFKAAFNADVFAAVDEILDDEQMRLFEKYFPLPYLIAAFPPVEVVTGE